MRICEQNAKWPLVSVIMPIYNEMNVIERCLGALLAQDYPQELIEIWIVDGGSDDGTIDIIEQMILSTSRKIKILKNPKRIQSIGLNMAIRRATGDIIIRVDGHSEIASNYIRQCVTALKRNDIENVGGSYRNVSKIITKSRETSFNKNIKLSEIIGNVIALSTNTFLGNGGACYRFPNISHEKYVDSVPLGAWRKEIFKEIGMFREDFSVDEDEEFNYRLLNAGRRILLSPKLKFNYYTRSSIKELWIQYFRYGYMKIRVMQLHPNHICLRHVIPFCFIGILLLGLILSIFSTFYQTIYLLFVCSYLVINITLSVLYSLKSKWYYSIFFPVIFTILHTAYGTGFLIGIISLIYNKITDYFQLNSSRVSKEISQ